jgi:hypothetical protein
MYCAEVQDYACEFPEAGTMSVAMPDSDSCAFAYDISASLARHRSEGSQKSLWVQLNSSADRLVVSLKLVFSDDQGTCGVSKVAIYAEPWPVPNVSAPRLAADSVPVRALTGVVVKQFVSPGELNNLRSRELNSHRAREALLRRVPKGEDENLLADMTQQFGVRTKRIRVKRR